MKIIVSAKEIEELLRNGGDVKSLPADAIFTPSARDRCGFENNGAPRSFSSPDKTPARSAQTW